MVSILNRLKHFKHTLMAFKVSGAKKRYGESKLEYGSCHVQKSKTSLSSASASASATYTNLRLSRCAAGKNSKTTCGKQKVTENSNRAGKPDFWNRGSRDPYLVLML